MKAVGLDTSVVVRLLTGLPEDQAGCAMDFLDHMQSEKRKALVSDLVVAETYFALVYHYEVPRQAAAEKLADFLESGMAQPDPKGSALETLRSREKTRAGFVDQLIRNQYLEYAEEVATFDADFARLEKVRRLTP